MEDLTLDLDGDSVNAVFYELHFPRADQSESDLNAVRDVCLGMVAPLLEGYIWQREAFQLCTSAEEAPPWRTSRPVGLAASRQSAGTSPQGLGSFRDESLPCLWGAVQFGDNLEDEWFITWLLQQLTLHIPGAAARVWDNDGEFLLIEAAYSLPRWLKPETSTNRVWLAGGKLHVVPLPSAAVPDIPSFPSLTQALQLVRSEHVPTLAGSEAQAAIQARLRDFQKGRHKHMHGARVIVPARVAALLAAEVQLVAPAVEAFHYRDVDDMRAAQRMQHFPAQDMVNVVASFSRCLYAQLEQQQFEPPKGYPLPPPDSPPYRAAHLGMKLTCGFEMLYSKREHHAEGNMDNGANASTEAGIAHAGCRMADAGSATTGRAQALSEEQVADNPSWRAYKSSLERNGYFKDNIPGSQQYRELMQAALQSFAASEAYKRSTAALAAPILRMQEILARPISKEQLEEEMQGAEDDDSWMRDGAAELERELAARQAEMGATASEKQPGTSFDPDDLAERMKAFVEKESSFEGAELPASAQRKGVSLDSKRFWAELGSALGMQPGDGGPFSDSEDEGSSFFGGGSDEDDVISSDAGDDVRSMEPDEADVYQAQRAERAQNGQTLPRTTTPSSAAGRRPEEPTETGGSQQKQATHREPAGAKKEAVAGTRTQPLGNGASHGLQGIKRGFLAGSKGATKSSGKPAAGVHSTAGATTVPHVGAAKAAASYAPAATTDPSSGGIAAAATSSAGASASGAGAAGSAAPSAARMDEDEHWEVLTATDSDDEPVGDADFMTEYGERMERELGRSKVGATFERMPLQTSASAAEPPVSDRKGKGKAVDVEDMGSAPGFVGARPARPAAGGLCEEEDEDEELQPVDIDLNLVQSLLASYAGQQGLPGPVSNLAGLMGLHLPDDEDSRGKSAFDSFLS
ncbi:probable protein ecdysoneless homolog [Coccomyxa sp. Obi]|nr:probable protein ecdysoneless homolog [Coccomyxa sp. Obi]